MRALVIGAAISGTAVAKLLAHHNYEVVICDHNSIESKDVLEALGIKVIERETPITLAQESFDLVVKNPGIPYSHPLVEAISEKQFIYTEIEIAARFSPQFVYGAITGTNGKTTTTTLLYEFLKEDYEDALYAGNIGRALSELVDGHETESHHIALEISAFQLLGCEQLKPKTAVIMNLTPDHLDYFNSLDEYYDAKCRIIMNMDENDVFLRNIDDPEIMKRISFAKCRIIDFSMEQTAELYADHQAVYYQGEVLFDIDLLHIVGRHNIQNAMVSAVMAIHLGVSIEAIRRVLESFHGVEHRIEFVRELDGVKYYNDSKGTNPEATEVALKAFVDKPVILLAGGYNKKTGFDLLVPYFSQLKKMIVYGETREELATLNPKAVKVETMQQALDMASRCTHDGDIVLLSPACASYDQFDNFEQRGRIFKELVNKL